MKIIRTCSSGVTLATLLCSCVLTSNPNSARAADPQEKARVKVIISQNDGPEEQEAEPKEEKAEQVPAEIAAEKNKEAKLWLGIMLKKIEGDLARYLGSEKGILVDAVYEGSPAEKAGVQEADVLLKANDRSLDDPTLLLDIMGGLTEGDRIELALLRKGEQIDIVVEPAPRPDMEELAIPLDDATELKLDLSELEGTDKAVREALRAMRQRSNGKDLNIFSFGGPAFTWRAAGDDHDDMDVKVVRELDGKKVEITIIRKDGPAEITVTRDGETKKYSEKDLDQMSDEVAEIVKQHIKPSARQRVEVQVIPKLEALELEIDQEQIAERAREMAEKYRKLAEERAEQARQGVSQLRARVERKTDATEELEQLRALVEELRSEVEELRRKLEDK